ncbi:cadherin-related family member 5-like [Dendronephthya gigantea]|uniref:cadherin-related family member 5-like n=1 Tax=Dendronephthya gigantea TaxID=151771 RepID=UPI00106A0D55|nr:cadherin-related family member 5-like [Dendronephthya gigantea]
MFLKHALGIIVVLLIVTGPLAESITVEELVNTFSNDWNGENDKWTTSEEDEYGTLQQGGSTRPGKLDGDNEPPEESDVLPEEDETLVLERSDNEPLEVLKRRLGLFDFQTRRPGRSEMQTRRPGRSEMQTRRPGRSEMQTRRPGRSEMQTRRPGRSEIQTRRPGRSEMQTRRPGRSEMQTRRPGRSEMQTRRPGRTTTLAKVLKL